MGQEISAEGMQKLEELLHAIGVMLGMSKDVVEAMITKYSREYKEEPYVKSFLKYLSKGGKISSIEIEPENVEAFRERLSHEHIDFIEQAVTRENGKQMSTFVFKDCDLGRVAEIRSAFQIELSHNSKELNVYEFKELMKGKQIGVASNLSEADVYAFRNNVKDTDLKFVVLQDANDMYKIYASDNEKLMEVALKSSYDVANDHNNEFQEAVHEYTSHRKSLIARLKDKEPFVLVDKENPNNFIYVENGMYSLQKFEKTVVEEGGKTIELIRDIINPKVYGLDNLSDKRNFLHAVEQMHMPVLLSAKDFPLLDHVDKNGHAFAHENERELEKLYGEVKERIKGMSLATAPFPRPKSQYTKENIEGYINLPSSLVARMEKDLPFIHSNGLDQIAFSKDKKVDVDKYLQENLLSKIQDPLLLQAFLWKIEGRSGSFQAELNDDVKTPFFILNGEDPANIIGLDEDGLHVYKNGEEVGNCPSVSEKYFETLKQYISPMYNPCPIILTADEMASPEKNEIIVERANKWIVNEPMNYMCQLEILEKEQLVEQKDKLNELSLSEAQKKAIITSHSMHITTKGYDKAIFAEMQDLKANKEYTLREDINL